MKTPSLFSKRIDALGRALGRSKTALGTEAGFSAETVRNWVSKADRAALRRTEDLHQFARHYDTTVEWLLGETEDGAPAVITHNMAADFSARVVSHVGAVLDTKAMADAAVDMLVELDRVPRALAAERMLHVKLSGPPSIEAYYRAGRLGTLPSATAKDFDAPPDKSRSKAR